MNPITSTSSQLREMDAEELAQEYERVLKEDVENYALLNEINIQYFQLTGHNYKSILINYL